MDPNVALQRLIAAACEGDTDSMSYYYHTLKAWLDRGGFPPNPIEYRLTKEK